MRVRFGGQWVADSEDVVLLNEPGRHPVAYFPLADVREGVLMSENRTTDHRDRPDDVPVVVARWPVGGR